MIKINLENKLSPRLKSMILIISLIIVGLIFGLIISNLSSSYVLDQIENRPSKTPDFELTEETRSQIFGLGLIWLFEGSRRSPSSSPVNRPTLRRFPTRFS